MSDKESKKIAVSSTNNDNVPASVKMVNDFLGLENCGKSIEMEAHKTRVTQIRKELTNYLNDTAWIYSK